MLRIFTTLPLIALLAACAAPATNLAAALSNQRVTFPSPDPESGPLVFEFYEGGEGLLAFDEVADRGQTPLRWSVNGTQVCLSEPDGGRLECSTVIVRGTQITLGPDRDEPMRGFLTPL